MERENPTLTSYSAEEATYGGSRLRMEYDRMEAQKRECDSQKWEKILVSIAFGAIVLMVTMVLIAAGASLA